MNSFDNTSKLLVERVKELNCLYEISKICQSESQPVDVTITQILEVIPQGWQYPKKLMVFLSFDTSIYGEQPNLGVLNSLKSTVKISEKIRGEIEVYYLDKNLDFLQEEQPLLNKIGIEIANFMDRVEQREKAAVMAEKMRYNDRLSVLGELTAGIAHELNTPLGNILGYAELLKKSERNPAKKADAEKIISSAKNAREIVKRLMYFSCEMPQQFGLENINEQIEENIALLYKQISENKVNVKLELSENMPLVRLDKLQFSQILFNLTLNAINAMDNGGNITISSGVENDSVVFKIKDDGRGMSENTLSKIYQPFFTTKPKGEGTGLGLAVVHGIVQNHQGTINLSSKLNVGTEFVITFPI